MVVLRDVFVAGSWRKHHALDSELHHVIKQGPYALGISSVEKCGIGSDPKAALQSFPNRIHSDLVAALAADGEIMVLLLTVQMHAEGQVLGRLEQMNLFLEQ